MNKIKKLVRETFDIRQGEGARVFLMFCYIFLVVTALMIVKPVANSLFLSHFGAARLPYVFILVAVGAASVSSLYSRWLLQIDMFRLMIRTLQLSIVSLLFFRIVLQEAFIRGGMLFVFYVWVALYGLITASQFWILANCIFNAREAKRLFGIVGAGAIAGGIFGGYLTRFLAAILGSANLLFISAACLLCCIGIVKKLYRLTAGDEYLQEARQKEQAVRSPKTPIRNILESRHLLFLAGIVGTSVMVGKLVEYQFSAVAASTITDPDQLTAFFGFWLSNLNVVSLLVQVFATRRVVSVLGVGISLMFLPAMVLSGAVLLMAYPTLWAAVFLKLADGGMKNSINKAALELMVLPIPADKKKQAKAFIDVFVDSAATGVGGLLLLGLTVPLGLSIRWVACVTVFLACVWCYLAIRIRREYIQSFRVSLSSTEAAGTAPSPQVVNDLVIDNLQSALGCDDEEKIVQGLVMAQSIQDERLLPRFKELVRHGSAKVRMEVLKNLYYYKNDDFTEEAHALIFDAFPFDPDQDVKTEAMHYLFRQSGAERVDLLKEFLTHDDYTVSGAATLCAARESRRNQKLKSLLGLQTVLESWLQQIPGIEDPDKALFYKVTSARAVGAANIPDLFPYLHIFFNDAETDVVEAAIHAAGESRHPEFIPVIIERMQSPELEVACGDALKEYGPAVFQLLFSYLDNPFIDRDIRQRIPLAAALLKSQPAVDLLMEHLNQRDPSIRFAVIRALNRLRLGGNHFKYDEQKIGRCILGEAKRYLSMLTALYHQIHHNAPAEPSKDDDAVKDRRHALSAMLERRLDENLERIFRLLGLRYPTEDILTVYKGIRSRKADLRSSAIEFLDNLLETDLKRALIPILETALIDTVIEQALDRLGMKIPSERHALEEMLPESDPPLQVQALELIDALNDRKYASLVGEMANSPDDNVQMAALSILKKMGYLH